MRATIGFAASLTRRLERELLRGARAAGLPPDLWTCPRVARLIAQRFNVHYHVDHIGRLLPPSAGARKSASPAGGRAG